MFLENHEKAESKLANHLDQLFRMRRFVFDLDDASKQIVDRLLCFLDIVFGGATHLRLISHLGIKQRAHNYGLHDFFFQCIDLFFELRGICVNSRHCFFIRKLYK